jgi:hypothetical protein
MDHIAFAIAVASLLFGAGLFLLSVHHHKRMWDNLNPDRQNLARFSGIFAPLIPGLLTQQGSAHRRRFVVYLVLALLLIIPFIVYGRGHGHLYPIN